MDKFRDKYRIPSARLQNWNYGWNASYFVTINTGGMAQHFGKIVQGKMHLSTIGQLAEKFWLEIPEHFPFVLLGVHQIMPNHMHGIITIHKTKINSQTAENGNWDTNNGKDGNDDANNITNGNDDTKNVVETRQCLVSTTPNNPPSMPPPTHNTPTNSPNDTTCPIGRKRFQNQGKDTLSSIVGSYKSVVSKYAHPINPKFAWHTRFYDHIIRNQAAYLRIKNYILNNPKNWEEDKNR